MDSRGLALAAFFAPTAKLGSGSFYFGTFNDSRGRPLSGEHTYRLHVSANVPVSEFWAFTVYSQETAALFCNSPRGTLDSLDKTAKKTPMAHSIGPKPPAGKESNWIYTPVGKAWFPWFRAYGPEKALLDKTWKLADIERIK